MLTRILQTTQAVGDFLVGATHDTIDAAVTGIGTIPGQIYSATKYTLGADRFLGEGRPWSKIGTGYRGDFWQGDNGLTRMAERFNHVVFSVVLGGVNTIAGGLPYEWVNQRMGVDCPYFFPGPQSARELGQFFSSALIVITTGRQVLGLRAATPRPISFPEPLAFAMPERPLAPPVAIGRFRPSYIVPNAVEEVAAHIRSGNVAAPPILRKMLDVRSPELIDPVARVTVELLSEGHLPVHLFETIIWDTHPRTQYLVHYMNVMRFRSPRINAIWRHMKLSAYQLDVLPDGASQLRPFLISDMPRPSQIQSLTPHEAYPIGRTHN